MEKILTEVFGIWYLIGAAFVFFMQAGFAMVEAGFTRAKNAGNIIMKNLMDFCLGTVAFLIIGYSLLMGHDFAGLIGWGESPLTNFAGTNWSSFTFNLVFCATAATIVSGAMAERTKFSMQWHITDRCDQRCKHCYIYEGKDKKCGLELDLDTLKAILEDFLQTCDKLERDPFLVITGGDPLLYKRIWDFLEILKEKEVHFGLLGNPFHLDYDVVKRLEDLGCINFQMSLDGLRKTHDYIRKPGSFDATLDALKYFEGSKIKTAIMTTVSKTNIAEIPELVDIVVEHKVSNFGFARYCPNPEDFDLLVAPKEYRDFLDKMWEKYMQNQECDTRFALKDHLWKLYLYEKGLFNPEEVNNPDNLVLDGCHCGITHITTLADGTVYACRRSETPVGKVPEQSFYDIFTGEEMDKYRQYDKFEHCSKCEIKNFCRGCPSVAKCLTGDFYSKDPQCWKKF